MASYTPEYPMIEVNPAIKNFFAYFYKISDTPDAHQEYAECFTEDATLVMASKTAKGRHGMRLQLFLERHFVRCAFS